MRVSRCMSMLFEVHNYWFLIFIIFSLRWSNRWHSTRIRTAGCWRSIRFAVPNGLNSSSHCRAGPRSRSWGRCTPDIGCWTLLDQLESWKKGSIWYIYIIILILIVAEKHIQAMSSDVFKYFHCFSMLFLVRCIEPVPIDLQTSLFQMLRQNEDGA